MFYFTVSATEKCLDCAKEETLLRTISNEECLGLSCLHVFYNRMYSREGEGGVTESWPGLKLRKLNPGGHREQKVFAWPRFLCVRCMLTHISEDCRMRAPRFINSTSLQSTTFCSDWRRGKWEVVRMLNYSRWIPQLKTWLPRRATR